MHLSYSTLLSFRFHNSDSKCGTNSFEPNFWDTFWLISSFVLNRALHDEKHYVNPKNPKSTCKCILTIHRFLFPIFQCRYMVQIHLGNIFWTI